jgi:hypothetical protein
VLPRLVSKADDQPPSAGATASKATPKTSTPSAAVAGKSQAAAVNVVKVQVNPVRVSEAELKNLPPIKAAATGSNLKFGGRSTAGRKIEVTSPKDGDVWEAGKEYSVTWESTGITGDVKIDVAANQYELHPVTGRTVNSGAYLFRVPRNFVGDYRVWRARVSTLDDTIYGLSPRLSLSTARTSIFNVRSMIRAGSIDPARRFITTRRIGSNSTS